MITLCMICQSVTSVDLKALPGLSHGLCIACMPGYLRQAGMTEEEIANFMKEYKEEKEHD